VRRQCERPGCGEPAAAAYGFDASERVAWLAPLGDGSAGGVLCQRHAERFAVPRGWWLNDRRQDATLFTSRVAPPTVVKAAPARARRRRRPVEPVEPVEPASVAPEPVEPVSVEPEPVDDTLPLDEAPAPPVVEQRWGQRVASMGDLGGLLDARTPLLARAFKQPGTAGERPPLAAGDAAS
jgi:hypothetical protein